MFSNTKFVNEIIFKIRHHIKLDYDDLNRLKHMPDYKDIIINHFNDNCSKSYGCIQSNK